MRRAGGPIAMMPGKSSPSEELSSRRMSSSVFRCVDKPLRLDRGVAPEATAGSIVGTNAPANFL